MSLVSISDLKEQPPDLLARYICMASELGELYDNFIREDDEDVAFVAGWHGAKSRSGGLHASEMSGMCRRQTWYSLTGEVRKEANLAPFWKKRFRIGHMYHAMVQEDWRRLCEKSNGFMTFSKEVRIDPSLQEVANDYDIHSSCDGIISFLERPYGATIIRVGLEIKTESPDEYAKLKEPKETHRRQTCVYMKCLDVPLMWTMYINKGNQNVIESRHPYLYAFDRKLWGVIEKETKEVRHLAVINKPPPRTEDICCQFCGYSWVCQPQCLERKARSEQYKKDRVLAEKKGKRFGPSGIRTPRNST